MPLPTVPQVAQYPPQLRYMATSTPSLWRPGMDISTPGALRRLKDEGAEIEFPSDVASRQKIQFDVIMFHGKRGDGKTTLSVATAMRLRQIWRNLKLRNKVFANFKVAFADMAHPKLVDEIVRFPDWCHDCLIIIDELAANFPSLRAGSREQLMFQTFLQMIRKLRVSVLFTTQFPTYVGAASNIQINWYVKPFLYDWHFYKPVAQRVADTIDYDVVDWFGSQTGFPIQHRWPPTPEDVCMRRTLRNVSKIYPLYDTDEVIPPFFAPNRENIMERSWGKEMKEEEEAVQEALAAARREAKEVTQGTDATTLEEVLDSLKQRLVAGGKEERLSSIFEQVKATDEGRGRYPTINALRKDIEGMGLNVGKMGTALMVGLRE